MIRPDRRPAALRAAALVIAIVGIGGCGSSSSTQTSRTSTPSAPSTSASVSTSTSTSTSTTSTSTTTTTPATAPSTTTSAATANTSGVPVCLTKNLRLSLSSSGGAAGTAFFFYDLANAGPAPCSMIGYPGVSVLDARGHIVQHPARRGAVTAAPVRLVILGTGQRARFLVNSTDVIPSPGCPRSFSGTTLQVYPPNQRTAILLPRTGTFCNLRVGPVQRAG